MTNNANDKTDQPELKEQLERQMEETRESLSQTVKELKETASKQYEAVRETVHGVLDYRDQFQKEPLVWSLGALSAGFALGYTLGFAHKTTKASRKKHAQLAAFADSLAKDLSTVGNSLVMPALSSKVKELFGFELTEALANMGNKPKRVGKSSFKRRLATKSAKKRPTAKKKA